MNPQIFQEPGQIGYRKVGDGPHPVVVLHGWFSDGQVFENLWPMLDVNQFRYYFVDVRGYGLSAQVPGSYTMVEVAADVMALADAQGWTSFSVVGHSMGGMMAQKIAALATPGRVAAVVAITSVPASGFPMDEASQGLFRGAKDSLEKRRMILNHTTGNRYPLAVSQLLAERSMVSSTPEVFDAYLTAWAETDFSAEVQGNTTPLLALVGAHDPAVTEELTRSTLLQWFPNAELRVIQDTGHYPMLETPWVFLAELECFLRSIWPKR